MMMMMMMMYFRFVCFCPNKEILKISQRVLLRQLDTKPHFNFILWSDLNINHEKNKVKEKVRILSKFVML